MLNESFFSSFTNLLYHTNKLTNLKRLCILFSCVKEIFQIIYENEHSDFAKCFEIVFKIWYIRNLIKHFRNYIKHCFQCFILQIKKHKFFDYLQSIDFSSISFHTITLNFILILSKIVNDIDTIMSIMWRISHSSLDQGEMWHESSRHRGLASHREVMKLSRSDEKISKW